MNFPAVDWGATFEEDCIAAVEAFVADEKRLRPETLDYRGTDLGSALERHLYIQLMQSRPLQYLYACALAGTPAEPQRLPPHLLAVAQKLVPALHDRVLPAARKATFQHKLKASAKRLLSLVGSTAAASSRPILAAVHHPKFVHYLRPLADSMPGQMAFLVASRAAAAQHEFPLGRDETCSLPHAVPQKSAASAAWPDLCQWAEELDQALARCEPACVLTVEGDAPYHELIARQARRRGITALCLQWGAFPYRSPRNGFRRMGHDAFLTWGEGFAEQLRPYNPGLTFIPVGDHMLEPIPSAKHRRLVFLLQGVNSTTIQPGHWQDFFAFLLWTAGQFPGWEIVIRPHPNLPPTPEEERSLRAHANVRLEDTSRVPLRDSVKGAALAVALTSSAILEAAADGAVPFLFNPTTAVPRFKPDFELWDAGLEVKTLWDAKHRMAELLAAGDPDAPAIRHFRPGLERLIAHFFHATGSAALANLRAELETAISDNTY
jgi:hypothetical protein